MDKWDAYPAARTRLLDAIAARNGGDGVVLSRDVHQARAGTLRRDPRNPASTALGTEFVATSISSEGDGADAPGRAAEFLDANPHLAFSHGRPGYTLHEVSARRMEVAFRSLPYVSRPGAPSIDAARFVVMAGQPSVVRM
jgi:alkaline phosphatase D